MPSTPSCYQVVRTRLCGGEKRKRKLACAGSCVLVSAKLTDTSVVCARPFFRVLVLLTVEFCGHCLATELSNLPVVMSNCVRAILHMWFCGVTNLLLPMLSPVAVGRLLSPLFPLCKDPRVVLMAFVTLDGLARVRLACQPGCAVLFFSSPVFCETM